MISKITFFHDFLAFLEEEKTNSIRYIFCLSLKYLDSFVGFSPCWKIWKFEEEKRKPGVKGCQEPPRLSPPPPWFWRKLLMANIYPPLWFHLGQRNQWFLLLVQKPWCNTAGAERPLKKYVNHHEKDNFDGQLSFVFVSASFPWISIRCKSW